MFGRVGLLAVFYGYDSKAANNSRSSDNCPINLTF